MRGLLGLAVMFGGGVYVVSRVGHAVFAMQDYLNALLAQVERALRS